MSAIISVGLLVKRREDAEKLAAPIFYEQNLPVSAKKLYLCSVFLTEICR